MKDAPKPGPPPVAKKPSVAKPQEAAGVENGAANGAAQKEPPPVAKKQFGAGAAFNKFGAGAAGAKGAPVKKINLFR
jgi:hypothetical protein